MKITYEDHMGSDLKTVNMARVSFKKRSEWDETFTFNRQEDGSNYIKRLKEKDINLIHYLAKNKHWAPFAHNVVTVHVKAPIFVARQLFKHKVAFIESEVSRRYVDDDPEFYFPELREAAENKKQGSGDLHKYRGLLIEEYKGHCEYSLKLYGELLESNVCPEQARIILPQNMYTEWFLTGSLPAYHRMYQLRTSEDAQKETRDVVEQLDPIMSQHYPVSWGALKKYG